MLFHLSDRLPRASLLPSSDCPQACSTTAPQRRWQLLTLTLTLVLAGALAACSDKAPPSAAPAGNSEAPIKVGVITLQPQSQVLTSTLPGRTSASMSAEIRPQISGIVQKRLFTEGALVQAGQALYQIDPAPYTVAEAAAKAALAKAQAQARSAQVNARRAAELVQIDAISRQSYEESQASAAQTAADVAAAQAALAGARINLRYTRISAPIAGRTGLSSVTPGALVTANQAGVLTTIAQLDPMHVDIVQSSTDVLSLQRELKEGRFERAATERGGVRITVQLEDGSTYPHPGRLQFSGVQVNPGTGAVTLRAVVPNPDGILLPGMFVQTLLPTGVSSDALLLPQQAVTRDIAGKASVLLATAEHKVERRPVELGRAIGNQWLVRSGVAAGDVVIVDGFPRIKVGDTVSPQPLPAGVPAAAAAAPAPAAPPAAAPAIAPAPVPAPAATAPGTAAPAAPTAHAAPPVATLPLPTNATR